MHTHTHTHTHTQNMLMPKIEKDFILLMHSLIILEDTNQLFAEF